MKLKITNTQTIEYPDDLAPEEVAALFENPRAEIEDDDDDLDDDDLDDDDEENDDEDAG